MSVLGLPTGASANPDGETNTEIANADSWRMLRAQNYHAGPMGLPEGATAAEIPAAMQADWNGYWDTTRAGTAPLQVGTGGWIARVSEKEAVYSDDGIVIYGLSRTTNLNWLAHQDAKIAAEWKRVYGFVPVPLA